MGKTHVIVLRITKGRSQAHGNSQLGTVWYYEEQ